MSCRNLYYLGGLFTLLLWLPFQTQAKAQDQRVTLNLQNVPVISVFTAIEKQTDFQFAYNRQQLESMRVGRVQLRNEPIASVLKLLEREANLEFLVLNKQISVKPKNQLLNRSKAETGLTAATRTVGGTVMDARTGDPLPGASIQAKGTRIGTTANASGQFKMTIPDEVHTLVVSYIGYQAAEVAVGSQTTFTIQLSPNAAALGEVVVVGYGTQSEKNVTGSIVKIKGREFEDQNIANFQQGIAGRLAGVQVSQTNGAPGGAMSIKIRGINSISSGSSPLVVVDGVPISSATNTQFAQGNEGAPGYTLDPLSTINPSDIQSIDVLKDAAAASIYGSRGSNGVILITTKKGSRNEKPVFNFSAYTGVQRLAKKIEVADAYEFARFSKIARDNLWVSLNPAKNLPSDPNSVRTTTANARIAEFLFPYINGTPGLTNTDWQDLVYRDAPQQSYQLSATGGTERTNYFVSGSYTDQQGIITNSGMKRYSARINLETDFSPRVRFGVNVSPSFSRNNEIQSEGAWGNEGVVITTLMYAPNLPAYNPDGSLALGKMLQVSKSGESAVALIENPLALATQIDNKLDQFRVLGNSFLSVKLLDKLTFRSSIGVDVNSYRRNYYRPKSINSRNEFVPTKTDNLGWSNAFTGINWLSENTLSYGNTFGDDHSIDAFVGYSIQKETNERSYVEGRNFPSDQVRSLNAAQTRTGITENREWSLLSYVARASYNFKSRYLLNLSLRRDGSSRFGKNTKWGYFPSASAAWRVSEEGFFPKNTVVSDLKLRASYGATGNTEIPYYGAVSTLNYTNYALGDQVVSGVAKATSPNNDLSWEKTKMLNMGMNVGLLGNKLNLSTDYYISNTNDLLLNVTLPASSGFSSSLQNVGSLRNQGFELALSADLKTGLVTWQPSLNFATNRNEVTALAPGQTQFLSGSGIPGDSYITRIGDAIGSYYGYKVLGIFQNEQQLNSRPRLSNQRVGDFIYQDSNNDGVLNAADRVVLGNYNPRYTFGISNTTTYRQFDLSFTVQGAQKFGVLNAMNRYLFEAWGNVFKSVATGSFVNEANPGTGAPRPVWGIGSNSHTTLSSFHIEDASFVRVRNITLGYTLPSLLTGKLGLQRTRLYVSANNVFTFTKYTGYNPEVANNTNDAIRGGEDFGNYPIAKSLIVGLNVSF